MYILNIERTIKKISVKIRDPIFENYYKQIGFFFFKENSYYSMKRLNLLLLENKLIEKNT